MKNIYYFAICAAVLVLPATAQAQTGGVRIGTPGTPDASAALDINSSKGLLLPRLTETQMSALSPVAGLLVYNADRNGFFGYRAAKAGGLISQVAASSTSGAALNTQQYSGSQTQTFTAVTTGTDWATVYGFLYSINNVGVSPGSTGSLDVTFSIQNTSTGAVLASHSGSFTVGTSLTTMRLALPCYGLTVGQSYSFTITRQYNSSAGIGLYFSYGDVYAGGELGGVPVGDLKFQIGQDAQTGGWVSIAP